MIAVLIIILLLILLFVLAMMCRTDHEDFHRLKNFSYAHRGLHGPGIPENSILAFRKAKEAGYGIELDIHLLADGNLAVIHDSALLRTTGANGIIENLTTADLKNYHLEGTDETIPEFHQVLELFDGKAPLVVELKVHGGNYAAVTEAACKMLDGYNGTYCMESFDPRCLLWLKKNRPDVIRGQLTEDYFASKSQLPLPLKWLLSENLGNFLTKPDFVAYRYTDRKTFSNVLCRDLWGARGVTWTLPNRAEYDAAVAEGWIPIFEGFEP
jgi:glycerophosphoryl diester phosphodiesterase